MDAVDRTITSSYNDDGQSKDGGKSSDVDRNQTEDTSSSSSSFLETSAASPPNSCKYLTDELGEDGRGEVNVRRKNTTEKRSSKSSLFRRALNTLRRSKPNAAQISRLRKYDKKLREHLERRRQDWQRFKFTFRASDLQYQSLPEKLIKFGMQDCAGIVEKRHMTKLVLLKERMRTARKAGNALAKRLEEVDALIKSCEKCAAPLDLDEAFFVDPENIVMRRGSTHDAADFEENIQRRVAALNEKLERAAYEKRLQDSLSSAELSALLRRAITLAAEAETQATIHLKDILHEIVATTSSSLHWTLVSRLLWWERPAGLHAFRMASAALVDQRTVIGALVSRLRDKLDSAPPIHRSSVALVSSYVTALVRQRSPVDTVFPKQKSKSVRLLQMMLERHLIGPNLTRACFNMGGDFPRDRVFEMSIAGAFKEGAEGLGVPKHFIFRKKGSEGDADTSSGGKRTRGKTTTPFALAALLLEKFGRASTPAESASILLLAVKSIYVEAELAATEYFGGAGRGGGDDHSSSSERQKKSVPNFTAEDLIPTLAWSCCIAYISGKSGFCVHRAIEYTSQCGGFDETFGGLVRNPTQRPRSHFLSEVQYYLTSLQVAACSLERYAPEDVSWRKEDRVTIAKVEEDVVDQNDATAGESSADVSVAEGRSSVGASLVTDISESSPAAGIPNVDDEVDVRVSVREDKSNFGPGDAVADKGDGVVATSNGVVVDAPSCAETAENEWRELHSWIEKEIEKQRTLVALGDLGLVSRSAAAGR
eukprot:g1326.t1